MEESDKEFIEKRLDNILKYEQELGKLFNFSDDEIKSDNLKLRTLERLIQLVADEMVDVNEYLIRKLSFPVPDDFQSSFLVLGKNKVLEKEFSSKLAPIVGLRNRLVHRYEEIDPELLLKTARTDKDSFKIYVKYIAEFLSKNRS